MLFRNERGGGQMKAFSFSIPQNVLFGEGVIAKLPQAAKQLGGTHAFLISGPTLEKMGVVDKSRKILLQAEIEASTFCQTEGNPSVETVERAAAAFLESGADFIVALGGGSVMDVAKAVGVVAKYGGCITDYEGADKVPGEIVPQIAIPTTAGTGSEVTAFSVITDHRRHYKLTVFSYKLIPSYALLDPLLLKSAPAFVAAACGIDALVHAVEAYLSLDASPFSEAMSEKAMELIGKSIRKYVEDRNDTEAASDMLVGSLLAGIAFSWARLGNVHAMSHPVSAYYNVPHGVANGILFPYVLGYNEVEGYKKYLKIYNYISPEKCSDEMFAAGMLERMVRDLNAQIGIPAKMSDVGVKQDHFEQMAEDAMKSGNVKVNPRTTSKSDILSLYRKAW